MLLREVFDVGAVEGARAEKTIRDTFVINETRLMPNTSRTCGFDVYRRLAGTFTITGFTRFGSGVVREIDGSHNAVVTVYAPSRGTSYSYPMNAPARYEYPQGGVVGGPSLIISAGFGEKVPGFPASSGQVVFTGVIVALSDEGIPFVSLDPEPIKFTGSPLIMPADRCAAL